MSRIIDQLESRCITDTSSMEYLASNYDVIIFEGCDLVGKSTLLKKIKDSIKGISYRPTYELVEFNEDRSRRYLPGLCALDFFLQTKKKEDTLLIDRGILSWITYGQYYHGHSPEVELKEVIRRCNDLFNNLKVLIVYNYHESKDSAKVIHTSAMNDREELDIYDESDFDKYMELYNDLNSIFMESFTHADCDIIAVDSINNNVELICSKYVKEEN